MMILYFQFILDEYSKMIFPSPAPYIYIIKREREIFSRIYIDLWTGRDGTGRGRIERTSRELKAAGPPTTPVTSDIAVE